MTSNFEFIRGEWPQVYADAVRAESYGRTDPRSCVFYARRVAEQIVVQIYDVKRLPVPYKSDLAARIGMPASAELSDRRRQARRTPSARSAMSPCTRVARSPIRPR